MDGYKSVLVKNDTGNADVILFIYHCLDPLCWISSSSKIMKSGQSHLNRSEKGFQFEIKIIHKKRKKTVVGVSKWEKDFHFIINSSHDSYKSDLEGHALEKIICLRKLNVGKEASIDEGRNFYEILKLDFDEIQMLNKDDQKKK